MGPLTCSERDPMHYFDAVVTSSPACLQRLGQPVLHLVSPTGAPAGASVFLPFWLLSRDRVPNAQSDNWAYGALFVFRPRSSRFETYAIASDYDELALQISERAGD